MCLRYLFQSVPAFIDASLEIFRISKTLFLCIFSQSRVTFEKAVYVFLRSIPTQGRLHACWHHFSLSLRRPATCLLWRCLQRSHGNGSCDQSVVRRAPGNSRRSSRCVSNRIVLRFVSRRRRSFRRTTVLSRNVNSTTIGQFDGISGANIRKSDAIGRAIDKRYANDARILYRVSLH